VRRQGRHVAALSGPSRRLAHDLFLRRMPWSGRSIGLEPPTAQRAPATPRPAHGRGREATLPWSRLFRRAESLQLPVSWSLLDGLRGSTGPASTAVRLEDAAFRCPDCGIELQLSILAEILPPPLPARDAAEYEDGVIRELGICHSPSSRGVAKSMIDTPSAGHFGRAVRQRSRPARAPLRLQPTRTVARRRHPMCCSV